MWSDMPNINGLKVTGNGIPQSNCSDHLQNVHKATKHDPAKEKWATLSITFKRSMFI